MAQIQKGVIPRYYQLKEILAKRIQSGEFQPGDQFPTVEQLCQEYGLSCGTVRRAIGMLIDAGLLRRDQGRGTFLNSPQLSPVFFQIANFDDEMKMRGWQPSTKLLNLRELPAQKLPGNCKSQWGKEQLKLFDCVWQMANRLHSRYVN